MCFEKVYQKGSSEISSQIASTIMEISKNSRLDGELEEHFSEEIYP